MVRGISKRISKHILKTTWKFFFPVESGELRFRLKIRVFRTEYCLKTAGGSSRIDDHTRYKYVYIMRSLVTYQDKHSKGNSISTRTHELSSVYFVRLAYSWLHSL